MEARVEGRIFGLLALALALFGIAAPYRWHDMPPLVSDGALVLAGVCTLLALFYLVPENRRRAVTANLTATWTPEGKVRRGKTRAIVGVLFLLGTCAAGYALFQWSPPPPPPKAPSAPQFILSTSTRFIFACYIPADTHITPTERAARLEALRKNAQAWGDAIGFEINMTDISNGIRITIEAKTLGARSKLISFGILAAVTKINFEMRRIDQQIIITVYPELPPGFEFFSMLTPDPNLPQITIFERNLETLLSARPNTCHLI